MNHDVIQKQQYMDLIHTRPRTAATPARCDRMSHPCRESGRPARERTISEQYGKTDKMPKSKGGRRGGLSPSRGVLGQNPGEDLGHSPKHKEVLGAFALQKSPFLPKGDGGRVEWRPMDGTKR